MREPDDVRAQLLKCRFARVPPLGILCVVVALVRGHQYLLLDPGSAKAGLVVASVVGQGRGLVARRMLSYGQRSAELFDRDLERFAVVQAITLGDAAAVVLPAVDHHCQAVVVREVVASLPGGFAQVPPHLGNAPAASPPLELQPLAVRPRRGDLAGRAHLPTSGLLLSNLLKVSVL